MAERQRIYVCDVYTRDENDKIRTIRKEISWDEACRVVEDIRRYCIGRTEVQKLRIANERRKAGDPVYVEANFYLYGIDF